MQEGRIVNYLNPFNDPFIEYLKMMVSKRIYHARRSDRGASAIEWAIITGLLAIIALAIFIIIERKIKSAANSINTGP
jgi:Flp pilus assembly pilin Flp